MAVPSAAAGLGITPVPRAWRHRWCAAALLLVALGVCGSIALGAMRHASVRHSERQRFQTAATDVAETAEMLVNQDASFVTALRTALTQQPNLSAGGFSRWVSELEEHQRDLGVVRTILVRTHAQPTTIGHRALQPRLAASSGSLIAYPQHAHGIDTFVIEGAFYSPNTPVARAARRRAAVRGWIGVAFSLPLFTTVALHPHTGLAITLSHRQGTQVWQRVGGGGHAAAPRFVTSATFARAGSWIARVVGAEAGARLSATVQGLLVSLTGLAFTLLLAAFVLTLGRERDRALGLVEQTTGELHHQSLHDALTGLPNRALALSRARQLLARARRDHMPVAALYVDIDGFKQVNDTFGDSAGDAILRIVAHRLSEVIRDCDTAARLGGDEFIVLLDDASLTVGPEIVAERILQALRRPYDLRASVGRELTLTASVGIAAGLAQTADELLRDADLALYQAKLAGRNRYVRFQSTMEAAARERAELEMDLGGALERGELFLLYQPTVDLRSERTIGVEALIRWQHPERGLISPDRFIPLAEHSGLIVKIGAWVLQEACRQAASWQTAGHPLTVAVNVSARQLEGTQLLEDVRSALQDSGLHAEHLTLEITETALMHDPEATAERLRTLKCLGVRIAIDDFGTGYSSLAYLRQLPADSLKIDRSFVNCVASSEQCAAIVHTLVALGKTLHITTLAEGIENRRQLNILQREQCDEGQGYLFARPLPADAVEAFILDHMPMPSMR